MGAKSRSVSYGSDRLMLGLTASPAETISSVYPSGLARATISEPSTLLAPARLSTTKVWPSRSPSLSATMRPRMSLVPPGAKGTISRTALVGYGCVVVGATSDAVWARDAPDTRRAAVTISARTDTCISDRSDYRIAHLRSGSLAAEIRGQLLCFRDHLVHRCVNQFRRFSRLRLVALAAQPLEQHLARHDHRVRIGDVLARDVRRRAVRRLRHRLTLAHAQPRREPQTSDDSRAFVGQDVAELVGRHHHVELLRVHHELHRKTVDQHFIELAVGELLRHLAALLGKHAADQTVDRFLVHAGHFLAAARACNFKRFTRDAIGAVARDHARADRDLVVRPELAIARHYGVGRLHALGHLAQEHDIHSLVHRLEVRIRLHRLDAREEIELLAQRRHDPGGIVARIGTVADRPRYPAVEALEPVHRYLRLGVAVQFVPLAADRKLLPPHLEPNLGRRGLHHFDGFGDYLEPDVVAQQNSNLHGEPFSVTVLEPACLETGEKHSLCLGHRPGILRTPCKPCAIPRLLSGPRQGAAISSDGRSPYKNAK